LLICLQKLPDKVLIMLSKKIPQKWGIFYWTLHLGMVFTIPKKIYQIYLFY
jgi:hypothetical protein